LRHRLEAWTSTVPLPAETRFGFAEFSLHDDDAGVELLAARSFVLRGETIVTEADVKSAEARDGEWRPYVAITLREEGAGRFEEATARHLHRRIALLVDGKVLNWPIVMSRIKGGVLQILMGSDDDPAFDEAERMARQLNGE
jgi:preprotein translocase subunit SecD